MKATCPAESREGNCPSGFAEATLVPAIANGPTPAELQFALAHSLIEDSPHACAVVLKSLRDLFPHSPLTVRIAALGPLARRKAIEKS